MGRIKITKSSIKFKFDGGVKQAQSGFGFHSKNWAMCVANSKGKATWIVSYESPKQNKMIHVTL